MATRDPEDDWNDEPAEPPKPLAYRRPADSWEKDESRNRPMFGNVWGNMGMGLVTFIASCFAGWKIADALDARSAWAVLALPCTTLLLGVIAATQPRYRGVLFGMILFIIGLPLLVVGYCALTWKGIH